MAMRKQVIESLEAVLGENGDEVVEKVARGSSSIAHSPIIQLIKNGWMGMMEFNVNFLEWAHVTTGLPFWLVIVLSSIAFRTVFLYPTFLAIRNGLRMQVSRPEVMKVQQAQRQAKKNPTTAEKQTTFQTTMSIYKKNGCSPFRSLKYTLPQAPFISACFFSLRFLTGSRPDLLISGGAFWFTNMTFPDPWVRLPILSATFTILNFEVNTESNTVRMPGSFNWIRLMVWGGSLAFCAFSSMMPPALHLFWCTSMIMSTTTNVLLKYTALGPYLGCPTREALKEAATFHTTRPFHTFSQEKPVPLPEMNPEALLKFASDQNIEMKGLPNYQKMERLAQKKKNPGKGF